MFNKIIGFIYEVYLIVTFYSPKTSTGVEYTQ